MSPYSTIGQTELIFSWLYSLHLLVLDEWFKLGSPWDGHVEGLGREEGLEVKQVEVIVIYKVRQQLVGQAVQRCHLGEGQVPTTVCRTIHMSEFTSMMNISGEGTWNKCGWDWVLKKIYYFNIYYVEYSRMQFDLILTEISQYWRLQVPLYQFVGTGSSATTL